MDKTKALVAGVLAALASPGSFATVGKYPQLQGSDLSRLRADVTRIGNDFKKAIQTYEHQATKKH